MRRTSVLIGVVFLACGPKGLKERLLNAERRATAAEQALEVAVQRMREVQPVAAEEALADARKALGDPDVAYYPEREQIRDRLAQAEALMPQVKRERARRDLELQVAEQQKR